MSGWDEVRLGAKSRQDEVLGSRTWKISELAGPLKTEFFDFITKHGGEREVAHIPERLLPLLQDMTSISVDSCL